jgi:predicted nucleotidyltransferase
MRNLSAEEMVCGQAHLQAVRALVLDELHDVKVRTYLFGSWARGTPKRTSDVDIAVEPLEALPPGTLARLRERLEESTIPYRVEVVDLSNADDGFRQRIKEEGILWSA